MRRAFDQIHAAFHNPHARSYRVVEVLIWTVIAISLLPVTAEMIWPDLEKEAQHGWLVWFDVGILVFFAIELLLRVISYVPPSLSLFRRSAAWHTHTHILGRLRFCAQPMILIDILAVLAIYPPLRTLRALRLFRLLRTVRAFRKARGILAVMRAIEESMPLYNSAFALLLLTVLAAGGSFYLAERGNHPQVKTLADGIWWALVTITTVGYGDISPVTPIGRVIAGALMVAGMFTLALFAGIVGSTLLGLVLQLRQEHFRMSLPANHTVICGYDEGARMLLDALREELPEHNRKMIIIAPGERPQGLPPDFAWVNGDPTREGELEKVRLSHANSVIVVGSRDRPPQAADATTILVLFTIRSYLKNHPVQETRRPLYVVAEILDSENVQHAYTSGADEVIETTRLGFSLLAHSITERGSGRIMTSVASAGAHSLYIAPFPFKAAMTFGELASTLRKKHRMVLLGLREPESGKVELSPKDETTAKPGDELIYLAQHALLFGSGKAS
jgi:voltage-gated potassium channel